MKLTGRHLRIDSIEDLRAFMELHGTTPTEARLANEVVRLRVALEAIANEPDDDEINPYPLRDRIEIARRALAGEKATG